MAEEETAASRMAAKATEEATEDAQNAEIRANQANATAQTPEQRQQIQETNDAAQATATSKVLDNVNLDGTTPPTVDQLKQAQATSRTLADNSATEGDILTGLDDAVNEIPDDAQASLDGTMRPFFEAMSSKIDDLIKRASGSAKFNEYKRLQGKVTEAVESKDPDAYNAATKELDSFIEDSLKESKTSLSEKTEGRGNLKNFSRIISLLKLLGIIGLLGLLTVLFKMNDGCWKWQDGAKSLKITDFDFSDGDNKKFCSCSNTNDFETPQPLSWCPSDVNKGSPTYVVCPPYNYPACTVKTDSSGIYYSYYITSPLGVFNSMVNQTSKVIKNAGSGIMNIVKWAVVVICVIATLYFGFSTFDTEEVGNRMYYGVATLLFAGGGVAGWILL